MCGAQAPTQSLGRAGGVLRSHPPALLPAQAFHPAVAFVVLVLSCQRLVAVVYSGSQSLFAGGAGVPPSGGSPLRRWPRRCWGVGSHRLERPFPKLRLLFLPELGRSFAQRWSDGVGIRSDGASARVGEFEGR